jgi:hypothetical protein
VDEQFDAYFHLRVRCVYKIHVTERNLGCTGTQRDLTTAMDAAKALYHLRENIPAPYAKSWKDVALACPDYGLLRDVVDTDKHGRLEKQTRQIANAKQIEERILITEYHDEQGKYTHSEKAVVLKLTGGGERYLFDVLTNVINYWQDELFQLGFIGKLPRYSFPPQKQPIPRGIANCGRIDFSILQGVAIKPTFQLRHYNYDTNQIEPTDLTGAAFTWTIYKREFSLEIAMVNVVTGQKITRTVMISEEENQRIFSFPSEGEQTIYLSSLPHVKAAYDDLAMEAKRLGGVHEAPQLAE